MRIEEVNYEEVLELRREVMYPQKTIEFVKLENDNEGIHLGIYTNNILASVVSVFLEDRILQFRKLATKNSFQNNGYASALLKYIILYTKEMEINKIWANSRVEVYPFYKQFGFAKTDKTFTKDGYNYVVIEFNHPNK